MDRIRTNGHRLDDEIRAWPKGRIESLISSATPEDLDRAIAVEERSLRDLAALLSPRARPRLEAIAREAQKLTRQNFGRTIGLYAPIYLSNVCSSDCVYCGFSAKSGMKGKRTTLDLEKFRLECEALANHGFQNVLLLTGDAPQVAPVDYIADAVTIGREYFPSVSVEVYAMNREDYSLLCDRGLEGVTLYMETFDRETYSQVHLSGPKRDYDYRLTALARAGCAGVRRLSVGVLLGLFDWRMDVFWLAIQARYLQKHCWQSAVSVSFPRLLHVPERFRIPHLLGDADLVQIMLALRLFLPEAGFNLSTRERAEFRNHLIPLGVTSMSAGSSTRPGGYATHRDTTLEQFEIEDRRCPEEVVEAIRMAGYDPVWKDFDLAFDAVLSRCECQVTLSEA
jgi:2-iminoacetate synthase